MDDFEARRPDGTARATSVRERFDSFLAPRADDLAGGAWLLGCGAVLPALVLLADVHMTILGISIEMLPWRPWSGAAAWACIGALLAWFPFRRRPGAWQALPAAAFGAGALLALAAGLWMLPAAVMFSLFVVGLPGFVPFLTAVVLARESRRCWRTARAALPGGGAGARVLASLLLCAAITATVGEWTRRIEEEAVAAILAVPPGRDPRAEETLRRLRWIPGTYLPALLRAARSDSADDAARASGAWERITGRSIEELAD